MPDSIPLLFQWHRRYRRAAEPRTRRSEAPEPAVAIDHSEIATAETHDVAAALQLGEADQLAGQRLADENPLPAPFHDAGRVHPPDLVVGVVPRVLEASRQGTQRRLPATCRHHLTQRLVRPLLVVVNPEALEPLLLLGSRRRRRLGGQSLQRTMHALVATVVLRARRRDIARFDAEPQPPHRQHRQPARSRRAERCTVVGTYRRGQPDLRKNPLARGLDASQRRRHDPHVEQIPARRIRDRQWVAATPVARAEPALEVDRPFLVGAAGRYNHLALRDRPPLPPPPLHQARTLQDVAHGRGRRPGQRRLLLRKPRLDLLRPEMREPMPDRDDALRHSRRRRMRAARHRMAQLLKPPLIPPPPTPQPDVKRLPADPIPPAQIAHRQRLRLVVPKQRDTLFHRTGLLEGHRSFSPNRAATVTCQQSTRSKLSGISPVHTPWGQTRRV